MKKRLQVYKCEQCGDVIEVLHAGEGDTVCCGEPSAALDEKSEDTGFEKHVPVVEQTAAGVKVKVGSVPHPMEAVHYIEWVEVIADGRVYRQFLEPGAAPEATFEIRADEVKAREYCTVHGLWKS